MSRAARKARRQAQRQGRAVRQVTHNATKPSGGVVGAVISRFKRPAPRPAPKPVHGVSHLRFAVTWFDNVWLRHEPAGIHGEVWRHAAPVARQSYVCGEVHNHWKPENGAPIKPGEKHVRLTIQDSVRHQLPTLILCEDCFTKLDQAASAKLRQRYENARGAA